MNVKAFQTFSKLVRLPYALSVAFGIFFSGMLAGDLMGFQTEYLIAFLVVFLSAVGSFAFNDFCDFAVDKSNKRYDRPLVSGLLPRRTTLLVAIVAFFFVILLSLSLNTVARTLVLTSLPFFIAYSLGLKKIFLVKNISIGYAYVATIFLGSLISNIVLEPLIIYFAVMGFIVGLAFEIMLDIGDVQGDKTLKIDTLAARLGEESAAKLSSVLYGVIMVLDPLPFFTMIDPRLYLDNIFLFLVCIPVIAYFFIIKSLIKDQSKSEIFRLKKRVFTIMLIGSMAYLIGILV